MQTFTSPLRPLLAALALSGSAAMADEPPAARWVTQAAVTDTQQFQLRLFSDDEQRHAVDALRVLDRQSGKTLQEITSIAGAGVWGQADELLRLVDANRDGHPDIQLPYADGGAGPNLADNFYLFDARTQHYVLHEQLSARTQVSIDADGNIHSASRGSCCQHHAETHRFVDGQLTLVADWDESYTADGEWIVTTTGTLVDGQWQYQTHVRPQPPAEQ